ncbi:MAG TPA: 2-phospho-L-lactate transferase [Solirubrobacteraceae bacterium]|nr:2-phospho-L-lactate transferase [Solirubrobacteraceae bacterium]
MTVVVLAGGTGGAKLARGMLDVVGEELVVIANTADDIEIYGAHVSPDPDLITYWLADRIDPRGWGIAGDTFAVMDGLRELGVDVWFSLGDRDLAVGLERMDRLREGARLTEAIADLGTAFAVRGRVLPMSDEPVRTWVASASAGGDAWSPLQEFLIRGAPDAAVRGVEFRGVEAARPTAEVLEALASARAIVIGPSNPIISIGPILAVPGLRETLRSAPAPVVAVSPIVAGEVLKGPTAAFMAWADQPLSGRGIAALYGELLDGIVADEPMDDLPTLRTDLLMSDAASRRRLADETLAFADALASAP